MSINLEMEQVLIIGMDITPTDRTLIEQLPLKESEEPPTVDCPKVVLLHRFLGSAKLFLAWRIIFLEDGAKLGQSQLHELDGLLEHLNYPIGLLSAIIKLGCGDIPRHSLYLSSSSKTEPPIFLIPMTL